MKKHTQIERWERKREKEREREKKRDRNEKMTAKTLKMKNKTV